MGVLLGVQMPVRRAPTVHAHGDNRVAQAIPVACRSFRFARLL